MIRAFVFARGGSKTLPGKNIRPLNGKPLLAYAIEQAKASKHITDVTVSSDSDEILTIAQEYGALTVRRPEGLATDDCPELYAWKHAIGMFDDFETFVSVPATAPLRSTADIDACIEALGANDMAVAVTPSRGFHKLAIMESGLLKPISDAYRRQEAPLVYEITGSCYAAKREYVAKAQRLWEGKVVPVIVPAERSIDIDTIYDFKLAELLTKQ